MQGAHAFGTIGPLVGLLNLHSLHSMQNEQSVQAGAGTSSDLLTAKQVQNTLHVDATTIYRMAADGRLPAVKVGRQWRFPAEGVQALLASGAVPTTPWVL